MCVCLSLWGLAVVSDPLSVHVRFVLFALHLTTTHWNIQRLQAEGTGADGQVHGWTAHRLVGRSVNQGRRMDGWKGRAPSGG